MKGFKGLLKKAKSTMSKSLGKKLIISVVSVCASLGLLAVGVFASVTNFNVQVESFANLNFVFNEGMMTAVRYGDVVYDEPDERIGQDATVGFDDGEYEPLLLYTNQSVEIDNVTYTNEITPNINEIEAPVDFKSYEGEIDKPESIQIAYIFCYRLNDTKRWV